MTLLRGMVGKKEGGSRSQVAEGHERQVQVPLVLSGEAAVRTLALESGLMLSRSGGHLSLSMRGWALA